MIVFFFNRMAFDQIQAPPASKEVVESLPSIPITTEHIGKFWVFNFVLSCYCCLTNQQ